MTPVPVGDLPHDHPPARHRVGVGERRQQRVVVAAAEDEPQRVGPQRRAHRPQRLGDRRRRRGAGRWRPPRRRPGGRRRPRARRRRRSSTWRRRRRPPARRRTAAPGVGRPRPAPAASGSPRPSTASPPAAQPCRPASATTSPASAPERSTGATVQAPRTVTAITTWSARVRSPPTTLAPTSAHSSAKPPANSSAHAAGRSAGRRQADGQRGGAAAHRVDVGQVGGGRPVTDVGGRGPVAAEVPALDHQVGRHDHVAGLHAQHRRVVPGADQHVLALREERRELRRSGRTRRCPPGSRREGVPCLHPTRRRVAQPRRPPSDTRAKRGRLASDNVPDQTEESTWSCRPTS